ncbi:MAG: hypothetical protein IPH84_17620 [Bacteroidales bacterium]|nr:hypothetical protein [Bacteroidales bacterium]
MYNFIDSPDTRKEKRLIWACTRSVQEAIGYVHRKSGKKSKSRWDLFLKVLSVFELLLKVTGQYKKGIR